MLQAIKYGRMMKIKQEKDVLDQERKTLNIQIQTMIKEKVGTMKSYSGYLSNNAEASQSMVDKVLLWISM